MSLDDWRHNIAYNAALQLATVALAAAGYRAARDAHHHRIIQSLSFTIDLDGRLVRRLDQARKRRNLTEYDTPGAISTSEANEVWEFASDLRALVVTWLSENHPNLLRS